MPDPARGLDLADELVRIAADEVERLRTQVAELTAENEKLREEAGLFPEVLHQAREARLQRLAEEEANWQSRLTTVAVETMTEGQASEVLGIFRECIHGRKA